MASRLDRLFGYYAADLHRLAPKHNDHFGCPLCCRVFERAADLGDIVAEEHVLSRRLGGRIVTLTCRDCNNRHGTELDAHLVQRVLVEAKKVPIRTRVKIGAASFGAETYLRTEPGELNEIVGIRQQSDPRQDAELERLGLEGREPVHLSLKFGYNPNRSVVALVRAAYLLMFRTFGYRYVLDVSAKVVRDQLQNPTQKGPVLEGVMWRITDLLPSGSTITIMHTPESTRSFFVVLSLDRDTGHLAGVTLPPPGSDGLEFYSRLLAAGPGQKAVTPLPIPPRGFLPFEKTWHHVTT